MIGGHFHRRLMLATVALLVFTWGRLPLLPAQTSEDAEAVRQAKTLARAFRSAARTILPTVVKIKTTTKPHAIYHSPQNNPFRGTPLEDLFGDRSPRSEDTPQAAGLGSGVIIDPSGIVLTNNHVIEGADEVVVQLSDGREFKAHDIKADEQSDLAVLHIEANERLPAAKLGDSDKLEIGDWVIAVGHPFELEFAVSAGIISAKGRSLAPVSRASFLQTDAAINPGNSGGPLVNLDGEVVGINTAIFSRTGGYQGIGFAIPINLAKWVTPQLVRTGKVERAYLGISMEALTPERASTLGLLPHQGVLVRQVLDEKTPAATAGLQAGDVITSFDGQPVTSPADLQQFVERSSLSSPYQLRVLRGGKPINLDVVLAKMPDDFGAEESILGSKPSFYTRPELGLMVMPVTRALAEQHGFEEAVGVIVLNVEMDRPAYKAGLREGMLIRRVDGREVNGLADFQKAIERASLEKGIEIEVQGRQGSRTFTLRSK
jgi:serine protease Do